MSSLFSQFVFLLRRSRAKSSYYQTLHTSTKMSSSTTSAALYAAVITSSSVTSALPEHAKDKQHHLKDGQGFRNPWDSWKGLKGPAIGRAMAARRLWGKANTPDTTPPTVTVQRPEFRSSRSSGSELRATWLGHACYYVEFPSGLRVLFDPVFSDRCSPLSWLGPKRYTKAPCEVEEIPFVDAVIISHCHYDHLDYPTIMKILRKHPNVHFFAPLGNKKWFVDSKVKPEQVTELDWWEERDMTVSMLKEKTKVHSESNTPDSSGPESILAKIGCLPCQHTANRSLSDQNKTLWSSWSVESEAKKVYFGGDTGYRSVPELPKGTDDYGEGHDYPHCPAFKEIGDLRGPFDLGLIPIGAYSPRFVMSQMHANPFDSVNIFKDTRCKRAMGIHWGTWVLTEEDVLEPPRLLREALRKSGIAEEGVFDICKIGESREF